AGGRRPWSWRRQPRARKVPAPPRGQLLASGGGTMSQQPATKPDTAAEPRADAQPSQSGNAPRRVLVVDDNLDAAEGLAMLLQLKGHQVATAYDGEGAID